MKFALYIERGEFVKFELKGVFNLVDGVECRLCEEVGDDL